MPIPRKSMTQYNVCISGGINTNIYNATLDVVVFYDTMPSRFARESLIVDCQEIICSGISTHRDSAPREKRVI